MYNMNKNMYCKVSSYRHVWTLKCSEQHNGQQSGISWHGFYTQNDANNHILNFDTIYAEHPVYTCYNLIISYANNCWLLPVESLWSHTKNTQSLIPMLLVRDTVRSPWFICSHYEDSTGTSHYCMLPTINIFPTQNAITYSNENFLISLFQTG